uniref:Uncharacterized protein n=1 Tax=Anas platyrhynchos TaxID=8839 RepID=A0A8B9TMM5_ANAPL
LPSDNLVWLTRKRCCALWYQWCCPHGPGPVLREVRCVKTKLGGEAVLLVASPKWEGMVLKRPRILHVSLVGSDADGLCAEKRHRRDVRPQLDLVSSCLQCTLATTANDRALIRNLVCRRSFST